MKTCSCLAEALGSLRRIWDWGIVGRGFDPACLPDIGYSSYAPVHRVGRIGERGEPTSTCDTHTKI
eukprot:1708577-Ditylum_brightwellii.AAC.1